MVSFFVLKNMWIRFQKAQPGVAVHQTVWMEDPKDAVKLIKDGIAARVTGPDGKSIEEDTPENSITQIAREEKRSFSNMEKELERRRKNKENRDEDTGKDKDDDKKKAKTSKKGGK